MNFFKINFILSYLFTGSILLFLAIFVYSKDKAKLINRVFAFYSFSIAWWSLNSVFMLLSRNKSIALFWDKTCLIGAVFIPAAFLDFGYTFLKRRNEKIKIIKLFYALSSTFLAFVLFTPYFVAGIERKHGNVLFSKAGPIYVIFIAYFFLATCWGIWLFYKEINNFSNKNRHYKAQVLYLFWATLLGYTGGGLNYNLVFNIPPFKIIPFGNYGVGLYGLVVAYAIVRFRLMDIRIVISKAMAFAMAVLPFLSIPYIVGDKAKSFFSTHLGDNWWYAPVTIAILLTFSAIRAYFYLDKKGKELFFQEERQYQRRLEGLSREIIRERDDIDRIIKSVVEGIKDSARLTFSSIYLFNPELKKYTLKQCQPGGANSWLPEEIDQDSQLIKLLFDKKEPIIPDEVNLDNHRLIDFDSGLIAPCIVEDKLNSILIAGHKPNNREYTQEDLIAFSQLAETVAKSIDNCLYWQSQKAILGDRERQARAAALDHMSSSMAHEIDNPIYFIMGHTKIIEGILKRKFQDKPQLQKETEEILSSFSYILEGVKRISSIIKAILEYSRGTGQELELIKPNEIVESFSMLSAHMFKHGSVNFSKDIQPNLPFIRGNKVRLEEILMNFASNSIHAVKNNKDKKANLKVYKKDEENVRIEFSDNGYGIEEAMIENIFLDFVTTKASTEGTGLGLAGVRKIVNQHHGRIWAESKGKNQGSTFIVELPIAKNVSEEELQDWKRKSQEKDFNQNVLF